MELQGSRGGQGWVRVRCSSGRAEHTRGSGWRSRILWGWSGQRWPAVPSTAFLKVSLAATSSLTLTDGLEYKMEVTLLFLKKKTDASYIFACVLKEMGLTQSHRLLVRPLDLPLQQILSLLVNFNHIWQKGKVLKDKSSSKVKQICTWAAVRRPQQLPQCENKLPRELNSHGGLGTVGTCVLDGQSMCSRPQSHHRTGCVLPKERWGTGGVIRTRGGHFWFVRFCGTLDTYHRKPGCISSAAQLAVPFFKLIYIKSLLKVTTTEIKFARICCQKPIF